MKQFFSLNGMESIRTSVHGTLSENFTFRRISMAAPVSRNCEYCGEEFTPRLSQINKGRGRFCSIKCGIAARNDKGENSPKWKGGTYLQHGYIMEYTGVGEYRSQHILVMERYLGRKLEKNECVHHINQIRNDNRLENLQLMTKSEHISLHHPGKDLSKWITYNCIVCNKEVEFLINRLKWGTPKFCSMDCRDKYKKEQSTKNALEKKAQKALAKETKKAKSN